MERAPCECVGCERRARRRSRARQRRRLSRADRHHRERGSARVRADVGIRPERGISKLEPARQPAAYRQPDKQPDEQNSGRLGLNGFSGRRAGSSTLNCSPIWRRSRFAATFDCSRFPRDRCTPSEACHSRGSTTPVRIPAQGISRNPCVVTGRSARKACAPLLLFGNLQIERLESRLERLDRRRSIVAAAVPAPEGWRRTGAARQSRPRARE